MVLSVLEAGPSHGYAVIESLRSRSGGVFDLPEGTIYPVLHRLEEAGLLTSQPDVVGQPSPPGLPVGSRRAAIADERSRVMVRVLRGGHGRSWGSIQHDHG